MFDKIKKLAAKRSLSVKGLARELGLSQNYFYNIRDGGSMSTVNLVAVAEYFNVTTDYLLGRQDIPETALEPPTEDLSAILSQTKNKVTYKEYELTPKDKDQISRVIQAVLWEKIGE